MCDRKWFAPKIGRHAKNKMENVGDHPGCKSRRKPEAKLSVTGSGGIETFLSFTGIWSLD
jgi:hypothetical protein